MPLPRIAATAALLALAPGAVLFALVMAGELRAWPALLGFVLCLVGSMGIASLYVTGMHRLSRSLRRAAEEEGPFSASAPFRLLPAMDEIEDGLARLTRSLRRRAELVGQLRAADGAIIEALPDPLLVLGADGAVLRANGAARLLLGAGGTGGADTGALLRHPLVAAALDQARAEGRAQGLDVFLPGAVARDLRVRLLPMDPPLADGGRIVMLLTDRSAARAVDRMRSDFVTNASHELRTPLASLSGFIETLRGPAREDAAAQERFLAIMAEQAERMRRLIDDLLDLARVEMSEHQPPEGEADIGAILRAEAAAMEPLLATRGARLRIDAPQGAMRVAPADAEQLAQVVRNLMENAIRHGRAGGLVRGRLEAAERSAAPGVMLSVIDDGPGIPPEHIPRLTERFYRVDRGRSRAAGGTGLGLAIVKHIVARHRGHLAIESEPGSGATFRIWLPAQASAGAGISPGPGSS
jgi:two-component system phosphate regulon sensor histidine kinase PhoR